MRDAANGAAMMRRARGEGRAEPYRKSAHRRAAEECSRAQREEHRRASSLIFFRGGDAEDVSFNLKAAFYEAQMKSQLDAKLVQKQSSGAIF